MTYDFDAVIDRRNTNATKLQKYAGSDILPFWIADMDFAVPDFILEPLRERLNHPIIGYTKKPDSLTLAFQRWLAHHFGWHVPDEEWIVWLPGVVPGLNMAVNMLASDEQVLVPTPIYYPFLDLQENTGRGQVAVPLALNDGLWSMDFTAMAQATTEQVKMVCIANPQIPPVGATACELQALGEFLTRHDLLLVSDEIHRQLILDENKQHLPIAHAVPEIAHRTVSLFAATKTYNIPGLGCAAAVVPDPTCGRVFWPPGATWCRARAAELHCLGSSV